MADALGRDGKQSSESISSVVEASGCDALNINVYSSHKRGSAVLLRCEVLNVLSGRTVSERMQGCFGGARLTSCHNVVCSVLVGTAGRG